MKHLIHRLSILLLVATASPAWAAPKYLKAHVTGTVQTQVIVSQNEGRIHTAPLNNQRIFKEFNVSPQDYELVVDLIGSGAFLALVPKQTAANLPEILILKPGQQGEVVIDTKAHVEKLETDLNPGTATNLFKDIGGEVVGAAYYQGSLQNAKITKFIFAVTARGTDPVGSISTSALLKLKVTTQGTFEPQ